MVGEALAATAAVQAARAFTRMPVPDPRPGPCAARIGALHHLHAPAPSTNPPATAGAANYFLQRGWQVAGTCRSEGKCARLVERGIQAFHFDPSEYDTLRRAVTSQRLGSCLLQAGASTLGRRGASALPARARAAPRALPACPRPTRPACHPSPRPLQRPRAGRAAGRQPRAVHRPPGRRGPRRRAGSRHLQPRAGAERGRGAVRLGGLHLLHLG